MGTGLRSHHHRVRDMDVIRHLKDRGYRSIGRMGVKGLSDDDLSDARLDLHDASSLSEEGIVADPVGSSDLSFTPDLSVADEAWARGRWLLALLVLQSTSSMVLDSYQQLLKDHLVVTLFLTMLVGAGGNAGNQSAIKVIRGLATGSIKNNGPSFRKILGQQAAVGGMLGASLAAGGWLRVYITNGNPLNASAISMSLLCIVFTSVVMGTTLPFGLARMGIDPANAGTTIQVIMDILGVAITCATCHLVLDQLAAQLA